MEEDDPDYRTPIGKVIKHINTLCKKPQIDSQLSEALDVFGETLDEQEKYLANGIFKINFSEAALFLQSSAELYGKRIDILWDQLLEYHTRLIKYDCEHQKEKGAAVDKQVIEKLEERRNRYKRRKKFKLVLQSSEAQKLMGLLFENEKEKQSNEDSDDEYCRLWKEMESKSTEMRKIPNIVYKQMTQTYRLRNYHILKSQDFEIWDPEDDEFNTRYSRVPGWHHTLHLFEYNDKGLLPDRNNIISRLRLTAYGRVRFLLSRKIPLDTPFEQYKDEYMAYRNKFFEDEAKKWQNMPLDSLEDLRKQLQYLTEKEREERGETATNDDTTKLGVKQGVQEPSSDKIDLLENSDEDSLFELSFTCDREFMTSDLFIRLEKLSSDLINTKLRQDSGFFDFSSDNDDCDNATITEISPEAGGAENATANAVTMDNGENASAEASNSVTADNVGDSTSVEAIRDVTMEADKSVEANGEVDANKDTNAADKEATDGPNESAGSDSGNGGETAETTDEIDNSDTRSYISDHDYCLTVPPLFESLQRGSSGADKDPKKNDTGQKVVKMSKESVKEPFFAVPRVIPRVVKVAEKREKPKERNNHTEDGQLLPKRRKLSAKQLEKLLQSKIKAVKEQKFEKFFSMNYQPQLGEGEVPLVEYESGDSDTENVDDLPDCNLSVHSRQDDNQSILSDHDYCQRTMEDLHNDSGFLDTSSNQAPSEGNLTQPDSTNSAGDKETPPQNTAGDLSISLEDEYERLLDLLKESRKNQDRPETNKIQSSSTERELKEKERKESQARVEEWRSSIAPILRNLREHDFDIHEYGSRIIDNMEVSERKPFSNIVEGKSSAEVVRYFISSLQLANTYNIEICGAQQGRLSNDTFGLKLLTKDRYHEHLEEYLAPSEETFREKLDRVRAMTAANKQASADEPSVKKPKLTVVLKNRKNKLLNNARKSISNNTPQDIRTVQLTTSEPSQQRNTGKVQDENNDLLNTYQAKSTSKGKSIIRRSAMSEKPSNAQLHDIDVSMPSTSRNFHSSYTYHRTVDEQIPSTSFQAYTSPEIVTPNFNRDRGSIGDVSPNKRRRDSNEDTFRERLAAVQGMNPDVQLHSTPRGPPPPKQVKVALTLEKKSLQFE